MYHLCGRPRQLYCHVYYTITTFLYFITQVIIYLASSIYLLAQTWPIFKTYTKMLSIKSIHYQSNSGKTRQCISFYYLCLCLLFYLVSIRTIFLDQLLIVCLKYKTQSYPPSHVHYKDYTIYTIVTTRFYNNDVGRDEIQHHEPVTNTRASIKVITIPL